MKILAIAIFLAAIGLSVSAETSSDAVSGASKKTALPAVQEAAIIARNFEYLPSSITLKKGLAARLYLTSIDRAHDIMIKKMRLKAKVVKGEVTIFDFTPNEIGTYEYVCDIYCGPGHRGMKGKIVVVNGNE